jgi:hypothetical protein
MSGHHVGHQWLYGAGAATVVFATSLASPRLPVTHSTSSAPTALALKNVTVIDVTDGRRLPDQTVLVVANRIQAVGPTNQVKVPADAKVVDAQGKFLVPGFWEMHAHIDDDVDRQYPLLIANGVTGVREMAQRGQFPDSFRVWQREVMAGTRVGPRAYGPSADLSTFAIQGPEDVVRIVDSLKAAGDVFIKFHGSPQENPVFLPVMNEARKVGIPVVGHLPPEGVSNIEAVDSGFMGVEHVNGYYDCVERPDKPSIPADSLAKECAAIAQAYIRHGTWYTPTITIDYYRYFLGSEHAIGSADPRVFADYQAYLRTLYRLGVRRFLTGTDCPVDGDQACGFTLLQELVILGETGLPPLDVLQAATLHPAQYIGGADSLGTVAAGKLADLVLLDADPLADIHNVLKIRAVVANGRYFDRPELDKMDPDAIAASKTFMAAWDGTKRLGR